MYESTSDQALVAHVLNGRSEAYAPLVERHLHGAYAIACAQVFNPADAEDAVQEAFLRAYQKLRTLRDPAKFGSWLLTIARHEAARISARGHGTKGADPAEVLAPEAAAPESEASQRELHAILRDQVARLPESAREVLLLHYFAGHNTREIAELLDIRQGAVLKRLQRAREHLAETMLHALGSARPSRESAAKQIARIAALTSAASLPAALSTAPAAAFSLATLLPKASSIAAALVGVCATVAVGWMYLSAQAPDPIEAAKTDSPAPLAAPAIPSAKAETSNPSSAEPVDSGNVAVSPEPLQVAQADPEPAPAPEPTSTPGFTTATGRWEFTVLLAGVEEDRLGMAAIEDLGTILKVTPDEENMQAIYHEMRRSAGQIVLTMDDEDVVGTLKGAFNAEYTELVLDGTIRTGAAGDSRTDDDAVAMEVKLVGKRVSQGQPTRGEQIEQLRALLKTFSDQLDRFVMKTGGYPSSMDALQPAYIADLTPYRSTATRTIEYRPPAAHDEVAIQQLTVAALEAASAQALADIEERLMTLWGDRFMGANAIFDVRDTVLEVHLQLRTQGRIDEVEDMKPASAALSPAAKTMRNAAQNASCMNNLKQLGLVTKLFQRDQAQELTPTGWRMTYPAFMADTRILTCPSDPQGTESYEILFPGASQEWLIALAKTVEGIAEETAEFDPASAVPLIIEKEKCSELDGRNVIFLDGHVERFNDTRWAAEIAPYLAYRE